MLHGVPADSSSSCPVCVLAWAFYCIALRAVSCDFGLSLGGPHCWDICKIYFMRILSSIFDDDLVVVHSDMKSEASHGNGLHCRTVNATQAKLVLHEAMVRRGCVVAHPRNIPAPSDNHISINKHST